MRRRKRAAGLLILCLLCVAVLAVPGAVVRWKESRVPVPYEGRVLGIPLVSDTAFLEERERMQSPENPGVYYEDVLLPYDESGMLYLSQELDGEWMGKLSDGQEAYFLCAEQDPYWERKQDAMRENHAFTLYLVGEACYYEMKLTVSGMPLVSLQTERSEEPGEVDYEADPDQWTYGRDVLYYGTVQVFNPGVNTGKYEILESNVCYHQKGGISYTFPKKGYSFKLQDYQGENVETSLLGMTAGSTWKLNALFTDNSRVREITASQLWEQLDLADATVKTEGPRMEYVEVILDNHYEGLYCLVQPVDEKKLNLDRNDFLYKIAGSWAPEDVDIQDAINRFWNMQTPIRIRYPKEITDYGMAWLPMRDYLNTFYRQKKVDYDSAIEKVDLGNLSDNLMILMVCAANDNCFKNTYYAARVREPGNYVMYRIPWDMDLTFGNCFNLNRRNYVEYNPNFKVVYMEEEFFWLWQSNPEVVGSYFLERWNRYRESFFSTEAIQSLLVSNRDYLWDTGAAVREQERWPEDTIDRDLDELLEYQEKRMEWLDSYFENWLE